MNKVKENSGVTVVTLAITVIVLIILAGVGINELTKDRSLIPETKEVKSQSEIESIKELIYADIHTKALSSSRAITRDEIMEIIAKYGEVSTDETVLTTNAGYEIDTNEIIVNSDISFSSSNTGDNLVQYINKLVRNETIKIGQYVDYTPNTLSQYKTPTQSSGFTTSTVSQDTGIRWIVFDIKDGKVRLISDRNTYSELALKGYDGYNNAVYLINDACKTLYSKKSVGEAKGLSMEDVQEKMKVDYKDHSGYGGRYSQINNSNSYFPKIVEQEKDQMINGKMGKVGQSEQNNLIVQGAEENANSFDLKNTFYQKDLRLSDFDKEIYYNMIVGDYSYMLSSRCINANASSNVAYYGAYGIDNTAIQQVVLYKTYGEMVQNISNSKMRPIVTLNADIKVDVNGSRDGTSENPWKLKL